MKRLIQVGLSMLLSVILPSLVCADDNLVTTSTGMLIIPQETQHVMTITADGQIEIDGKAVEKMSDPEVKAAIREFVDTYKKQVENDILIKYYDRQTDYLLNELIKCREGR